MIVDSLLSIHFHNAMESYSKCPWYSQVGINEKIQEKDTIHLENTDLSSLGIIWNF